MERYRLNFQCLIYGSNCFKPLELFHYMGFSLCSSSFSSSSSSCIRSKLTIKLFRPAESMAGVAPKVGAEISMWECPKPCPDGARWDPKARDTKCQGEQSQVFLLGKLTECCSNAHKGLKEKRGAVPSYVHGEGVRVGSLYEV